MELRGTDIFSGGVLGMRREVLLETYRVDFLECFQLGLMLIWSTRSENEE
jgi:hypothetical protein